MRLENSNGALGEGAAKCSATIVVMISYLVTALNGFPSASERDFDKYFSFLKVVISFKSSVLRSICQAYFWKRIAHSKQLILKMADAQKTKRQSKTEKFIRGAGEVREDPEVSGAKYRTCRVAVSTTAVRESS